MGRTRIIQVVSITLATTSLYVGNVNGAQMQQAQQKAQQDGKRAQSSSIITFFIKPYPQEITTGESSEQKEDIQSIDITPGAVNRALLRNKTSHRRYQGIYATYSGFSAYSDGNGQITFPRKHTSELITLVVTPHMQPIIFQGTSVQYFTIDPDTPAAWYTFTRGINPLDNKLSWLIRSVSIPKNRRIPAHAIVINAQPQEIIIHEGLTPTYPSPNMILPDIYAANSISTTLDALSFLQVNRYFAPVKTIYAYGTNRYAVLAMP